MPPVGDRSARVVDRWWTLKPALRDAVIALFKFRTPLPSSAEVNALCHQYGEAIREELKLPPDTPHAEAMRIFSENVQLRNEVFALIREIRGGQ